MSEPHNVFPGPPDLLQFASTEHQQFFTNLVNCHEEIGILAALHALYEAALSNRTIGPGDAIILHLLIFVHYHFLFSSMTYMRAHSAEAFSSTRVAIDATLIATHIIQDRASQADYYNRKPPFLQMVRHYKNRIKDNKSLPHRLIPNLLQRYDLCSTYASHADVNSFAHRTTITRGPDPMLSFGYFQYPTDPMKHRRHFLFLLHSYVICLDLFSDFHS